MRRNSLEKKINKKYNGSPFCADYILYVLQYLMIQEYDFQDL